MKINKNMISTTVFTKVQNSNRVEYDSSDDLSTESDDHIERGANSDPVKLSTGYLGLDLFTNLVRGLEEKKLYDLGNSIIDTNKYQEVVDLFVLMFQTRDCRGGKGERDLFYSFFNVLSHRFPNTCSSLIKLIPEYGSFGDLSNLIESIGSDTCVNGKQIVTDSLKFLAYALVKDWNDLKVNSEAKISLSGKWAPREKSHFYNSQPDSFRELTKLVKTGLILSNNQEFSTMPLAKAYRIVITKLNTHLKTVEVSMCADRYQDIGFSSVPSVALKKWRKAFLNEKLKENPTGEEMETGNRFPKNEGRVAARTNLRTTVKEKKVKGGQLQAHEIVSAFNYSNGNVTIGDSSKSLSVDEKLLLEAQWVDMRTKIQIGTPRTIIPMADVSGSMGSGSSTVSPISVSVALSILLSEITHPAFRDRVLTFSSEPKWVDLSDISTLEKKIEKVCEDKSNGMNTNLEAAFELILTTAISKRLGTYDIPTIVIFSDMQFDSCIKGSRSETYNMSTFERASKRFKSEGLTLPQVIFWNLNSSSGFPIDGSTPGTTLLSGYSQSLFKYIVFGEEVKEQTAYDLYREIIDSERYDPVREILSSSDELSGFVKDIKVVSIDDKETSLKLLTISNPILIKASDEIYGIGL